MIIMRKLKYVKLFETYLETDFNRVRNWKPILEETALHLLSYSPLGRITLKLWGYLDELEKYNPVYM